MYKKWMGAFCAAFAAIALVVAAPSTIEPSPVAKDVLPVSEASARLSSVVAGEQPQAEASSDTATTFSFRSPVFHLTPGRYEDGAIGDVTGDGRDDVVVVTSGDDGDARNFVVVRSQTEAGELDSRMYGYVYPGTMEQAGRTLNLADMNNDGLLDIVVVHNNGVTILESQGDRQRFARTFETSTGITAKESQILDVDRDGFGDVAVMTETEGAAMLYMGDGNGGIKAARPLPIPNGADLEVADVTSDGLPDLLLSNPGGYSNLEVYVHNGKDAFDPPIVYPTPDSQYRRNLVVADFDDDGRNDVAIARYRNLRDGTGYSYPDADLGLFFQDSARGLTYKAALKFIGAPLVPTASDLDRDGRKDLFARDVSSNSLRYYLRTADGFEAPRSITTSGGIIGTGDLNGDACTDLVLKNNATTAERIEIHYGQGCIVPGSPTVIDDLNSDRKSDLLWRDDVQHHLATWAMDGASVIGGAAYGVGPSWSVVARGDFDGNGRLDLVWSDGYTMQMWKGMESGYVGVGMQSFPTGYRVVSVGDVDGDGRADLGWRDAGNSTYALWLMDGERVRSGRAYGVSQSWRIAGTGDLNGDRRLDLVWTDGQSMHLWSGAVNLLFNTAAMGSYPTGWELIGTGDVTGDGRDDLFWRHAGLGYFVTWKMAGTRRVSGAQYSVDGSWRVLHAGDHTGDGLTDLVWTNGNAMQLWAATDNGFAGYGMRDYPVGWSLVTH
ncbi:FG-GAP repeat domain-containing protein [Cognatilysobacter bugurensis]|uniref:VCBS repeat-containing protein n=1 Tax=Cognatilysobacter bugurensis TaxID=543356 RepID=A0A918SU66_9GAMM|nr:VCBS repeat-containing protein [Lysobacter bugurensis]GHA71320.1 hypothetical protein GCM10007067_04540 [Lysobacter bugurensis]